jgi:hypothetical protein
MHASLIGTIIAITRMPAMENKMGIESCGNKDISIISP